MRAWWRANRWYLVALAVAIPAAVAVAMVPRWLPYLERQPVAEAVALGETVRYSGAELALVELTVLDGDDWGVPGADVVVATLEVDVVEPVETLCTVEVVSSEGGLERVWDAAPYSSDFVVPDEFETRCSFAEAGRYDLQVPFLVPADEVAEPVVQVISAAELPRVLRLR